MSGIDYSTFIEFRKRLKQHRQFRNMFRVLSSVIAMHLTTIIDVLDSSFVETYSTHDEQGSEYSGCGEKRLQTAPNH